MNLVLTDLCKTLTFSESQFLNRFVPLKFGLESLENYSKCGAYKRTFTFINALSSEFRPVCV